MCSDPLISVIIPAYRAETTVAEAVQSVLSQSLGDFEIIVVNDASPDATAEAVERAFADASSGISRSRLKLINHTENRGSAASWQTGLDAATGRYVTKLDADDSLLPEALQALATSAREGADVVQGQFVVVKGSRRAIRGPRRDAVHLNRMPIDVNHFSLCGKIIAHSLLTDPEMHAFPGLDCWEDLGVMARVYATEPTIALIDMPVYRYNIRPRGTSLSTSAKERLLHDHITIASLLDRWFTERNLQEIYRPFLLHLKFAAKVKHMRAPGRDLSAWKNTFPEVNSRVMQLTHVPLHYRLAFAAASLLPSRKKCQK